MATGGIFQLITNDGKQDRMLMATALLNRRLLEIERLRSMNPQIKDPTPTLVDIERTHILFMNAHFKPFCAIGYEYGKVSVQSGSARLGASGVQFSIPQFGDFFNDMCLHIILGSVSATNAAYWSNPANNPADGAELLAYVDYLGNALLQSVSFTVNGNPLDEYDEEVTNFQEKFFIQPHKRVGWQRNVGQEVAQPGFVNVNNLVSTGPTAGYYTGRGAGVRQGIQVFSGPQTPKPTQPSIEMWIPLLFWFNRDPRLSIPSVSIPYGQRFINVNFANPNQILQHLHAYNPALDSPGTNVVPTPDISTCELWINNIFVNPEIHDIFIKRIGFSLIRVHRRQVIRVNTAQDQLLLNQLKWPIETIYLGFRPTTQIDVTNTLMLTGRYMYSQISWNPVDLCGLQNSYSFAQAMPASNITADDYSQYFVSFTGLGVDFASELSTLIGSTVAGTTVLTGNQVNAVLVASGYPPLSLPASALTGNPTEAQIAAALPGVNCEASYQVQTPTVETLEIAAHGVPLYRAIPAQFFNSYIPYTYGGIHINTPYDVGAYMITFNLYPGSYQPSGYVNVSRAREFYLIYTSAEIGSTVPQADLSIVAIAINFLLISDGSAVLRYST